MNINQLPKIVGKKKKRVGRGIGTGKGGHTVGRGQKGQKSREGIGILFFGTKMKKSLIKKLPMQRGKGKLKPRLRPIAIPVNRLSLLKEDTINMDILVKHGIIKNSDKKRGVKIIGGGPLGEASKLEKKFNFQVPTTRGVARFALKGKEK